MRAPPRLDLREAALTATLLSVYVTARSTARALGAVERLMR